MNGALSVKYPPHMDLFVVIILPSHTKLRGIRNCRIYGENNF